MRTVIFFGLLMIADAIYLLGDIENPINPEVSQFVGIILIVAVIIDIVEFFKISSRN